MILFARIVPLGLTAFLFALLGILMFRETFFWHILIVLTIAVFFGYALLFRFRTDTEFWHYFAILIVFVGSGIGLLVFISGTWLAVLLTLLLPALSGWYLQNLFWYRHEPHRYEAFAIENIVAYLLVLSSFNFFSMVLAMRVFLTMSLLNTLALATAYSFLILSISTWTARKDFRSRWPYIAVGTLLVFELMGVTVTLPTGYLVGGLFLAVVLYAMTQLFRSALNCALEKKKIQRYALLCGIVSVGIFMTALWV